MPLRRPDRRHAWARVLDSQSWLDTAPSGRGRQGRARAQRAISLQAGTRRAGALRRQFKTPWPPSSPPAASTPSGELIDYYLAQDAKGEVRLEVLDVSGKVVRRIRAPSLSLIPNPGKDMAASDAVCRKTPTGPRTCGLPLYWPAPQFIVSPKAGMHRFSWDLKFDPVSPADLVPAGDEEATGAVPGRTYPNYTYVGPTREVHPSARR